jgi:hypothetical protein
MAGGMDFELPDREGELREAAAIDFMNECDRRSRHRWWRDAWQRSLKQGEAANVLLADAGVLRALHRCDCILVLEPGAEGGPTACLWNGFGLHLVDDPATVARREVLLGAGQ